MALSNFVFEAGPSLHVEQQELRARAALDFERVGIFYRCAITGLQFLARDGHLALNDVQTLRVTRSEAMRELLAGVQLPEADCPHRRGCPPRHRAVHQRRAA